MKTTLDTPPSAADPAPTGFRTKTGHCVLEAGRLVLSRRGMRGRAAQGLVGSSVWRALVLYLVLAAGFAFLGIRGVVEGRYLTGGVLGFISLYLAYAVWRSRDISAVSEIPLAAISRVTPHPPRPPLTRGYFEVHFEEGGRVRRRLVMLPGVLQGGQEEFNQARKVLEAAGVPLRT